MKNKLPVLLKMDESRALTPGQFFKKINMKQISLVGLSQHLKKQIKFWGKYYSNKPKPPKPKKPAY